MRVIGFMPIHYGIEYLEASLLSIKNHCEKVVVAYSHKPSQGQPEKGTCPDKAEDIKSICESVLGDKLIWVEAINYPSENEHRRVIHNYSQGFDLALSIDADEVYESSELTEALRFAYINTERWYGLKGYVNFWRSFDYACYDGFRPIRIENLKNHNTLQNHECPLTVYHFSTAQSEPVMRYKYGIFGHATEVRADWLDKVYYSWTPQNQFNDVHCVAFGIWNPVKFDKNKLPDSLKKHSNFFKELI